MTRPLVLHVEDDPNDRTFVALHFRRSAPDIDLRSVDDGQEAADYLAGQGAYADRERHPFPRLVLLDLKLPRMSGLELLAWARTQPFKDSLPILVLTSSAEKSDIDRAYELGARSYLVKTVEMSGLRDIVLGVAELARGVGSRP
jgi:CheY-like chemotaxis protein